MKHVRFLKVIIALFIAASVLLLSACPSGFLYEVVEEIEIAEKGFSVTFNTGGGTSVSTQYIQEDGPVAQPSDPSRTGYTFLGWYRDQALTTPWDFENDLVSGDTVIYAGWDANQYEVRFDLTGGTGSTGPVTVVFGSPMPDAGDPPTKSGYYFGGYYSGADGAGTRYYDSSMQSAHVWDRASASNLYAYWIEPAAGNFMVSFDSQGADIPADPAFIELASGTSVESLPGIPIKAGYHFNGWWTETNGQGSWFGASTTVDNNMTVYAHWITEFSDGSSIPPTNVVLSMIGLDQLISALGAGTTVFADVAVDSGNPLYTDYPGLTLNGQIVVSLAVAGEVETITIDGVVNFSGSAGYPYATVTFEQTSWTRGVDGAVDPITVYETASSGSVVFDSLRYQMVDVIRSIQAAGAMMDINLELIDLADMYPDPPDNTVSYDVLDDYTYRVVLNGYTGYSGGYLEPLGLTATGTATVNFNIGTPSVITVDSSTEPLTLNNFVFSSVAMNTIEFTWPTDSPSGLPDSIEGVFTVDGDDYSAAELYRILLYVYEDA